MSDLRRTPRINLSVALTAPLLLHRLLFITPLSRGPHKRLYSSTPLIVYYLTVMLLYTLAVIMFLANNSGHTRSAIDTYGYTWYGILTIDFFLNKASFLFISGMSVYRRHCQIEFFHTIAAIDARLRRHCGVRMHYERLLVGYAVVLVGCFVSTYVAWRMALQSLGIVELIADKALMNIWMFSVMFVLERLPVMLITVAFACCALLIRQRLQQLANRLRWQRGAGVAARCGAVGFEHTLQVYTELCRLTELLSGYMGAIMLMRLVHDFLSITTSAYFLFSAIIQRPDNVRRSWVSSYGSALALFGLQLASPVLVCLTAEWTLMARRDCQRELNRFETKTAADRELMDSFHYWSLHNTLDFTAAQFVSINAALLFAIFGAMSTYLLVLLQFQQQEAVLNRNDAHYHPTNLTRILHDAD